MDWSQIFVLALLAAVAGGGHSEFGGGDAGVARAPAPAQRNSNSYASD